MLAQAYVEDLDSDGDVEYSVSQLWAAVHSLRRGARSCMSLFSIGRRIPYKAPACLWDTPPGGLHCMLSVSLFTLYSFFTS
jgi:hypothetical protein